jgi:uncharacterized protein with HEPN domain
VPPTAEDRLNDVLEAILKIEKLTTGLDLAHFETDELTRLATERLLEILCEASRSIPDSIKETAPAIHWRKMVDFGNLLRHAYHTTDVAKVWDIVANELPPLKVFVAGKLDALK